jgi:hypothetical protein
MVADVTSRLSAIHTAVTTSLTLEVHPTRLDQRQFVTWHPGPVPPLHVFDRVWAATVCGDRAHAVIDPKTGTRARVSQMPSGGGSLGLRSSRPLIRLPPNISAVIPRRQLPSYRVVIDAYPEFDGKFEIGFIPSHVGAKSTNSLVTPRVGYPIFEAGGWWFSVYEKSHGPICAQSTYLGWVVMAPLGPNNANAPVGNMSTYATMPIVPPLPPGGAVELAVDYAAGTCRVAFYTREAVAGGFVAAPFATMELRFVATEKYGSIPARAVPTEADPNVLLYPVVATNGPGAIWHFA